MIEEGGGEEGREEVKEVEDGGVSFDEDAGKARRSLCFVIFSFFLLLPLFPLPNSPANHRRHVTHSDRQPEKKLAEKEAEMRSADAGQEGGERD